MMIGTPGYRFKRMQTLVITRKDALDITQALRAVFPALRITYWCYFDRFGSRHDWSKRQDRWRDGGGPKSGLPYPGADLPHPSKVPIPYLESFAAPETMDYMAWIEPPGWKPEWPLQPWENGLFQLSNRPNRWFAISRCTFHVQSPRGDDAQYDFEDPPEPRSDDEVIMLTGLQFFSEWKEGDKEAASFFNKVFRIVMKMTTGSFVSVGKGYKARSESFEAPPSYYRAGRDACAWALQRRHNYFGDRWKPGNYPYTPDQRYTRAELEAEKAAHRREVEVAMAELEDRLRSQRRGSKRS